VETAAGDATDRWVAELSTPGPGRDDAYARLHEMLLKVAFHELTRRPSAVGIEGPERDDLAHQAAGDAMLAILGKLPQFRGESRFTTWAYRFVVLEVSSKLGRHYWRKPTTRTVALDDDAWSRFEDRFGLLPEQHAQARELSAAVRRAVGDLTAHQRELFVAVVIDAVPLDTLVQQRGTTRNAIYKTIFDARRKIRSALVAEGYLDEGRTTR
jgi:RNA polymerase sigma-70 factor (ECF subfamily)